MAVTQYHSISSKIRGHSDSNARYTYLTDALGSVTATVTNGNSVVTLMRFTPCGRLGYSTTLARFTSFGWSGIWGYRASSTTQSKYVRKRHFHSTVARWTTMDPYWPRLSAYGYVESNYSSVVDPTGSEPCNKPCCCCAESLLELGIKEYRWQPRIDRPCKKNPFVGHYFTLKTVYLNRELYSGDQEGHCTAEWWEKSDLAETGINGPYPVGEWYRNRNDGSHSVFDVWNKRDRSCPGPQNYPYLFDCPSAIEVIAGDFDRSKYSYERTLCLFAVLKSYEGCVSCPVKLKSKKYEQKIKIVAGKIIVLELKPSSFSLLCSDNPPGY